MANNLTTSRFITLEGGEGSGKSTQAALLSETLRASGHDVVTTREPGGTAFGELVRGIILDPAGPDRAQLADALLFSAVRADHVQSLIRPALERGAIVICDRFIDSTRVYQGLTGEVSDADIRSLETVSTGGVLPGLTLILDISAEDGLARARVRANNQPSDRYEARPLAYHQRLRDGFLAIAAAEPKRCRVVDAAHEPALVAVAIKGIVEVHLRGAV